MLAVVTGGSSGLGLALCHALVSQGYEVVAIARHFEGSFSFKTWNIDLCNTQDRKRLMTFLETTPPDLLINNAGVGFYGNAIDLPLELHHTMSLLNAQVVLELTVTTAQALRKLNRLGTIVNVSSILGYLPCPAFATYSASKAFVTSFSSALDYELSPYGIRVLTSVPGPINTSFRDRAAGFVTQEQPSHRRALSKEKAAQLILKQIQRGQSIQVIPFWCHVCYSVIRWIPKRWVMPFLHKAILQRLKVDL